MSDIKLISPLLDNFCIGDPISDKNGVRSCPAMKENEDDRYILKVISIPASQQKLEALLLAGAYPNAEAANEYFLEQAQSVIRELETLNSFTEQEGFFPVLQWQLQPMDKGETGYEIYILTDYRRTLKRQFYKDPLTHLNAVNLGIDICAALTACRKAGYLYIDLKPTNILVTPEKSFKIGDLGFVKLDNLAYAPLPERYRSAYTAPEVADAFATLSSNMDVYALGLVLYQAYNNGALPFNEENAPAKVFEAPEYADYEMSEIILKACDPDPANRWQDPAEMGQALVGYMQRNGANDTPIIPVIPVVEPEPVVEDQDNNESPVVEHVFNFDRFAGSVQPDDLDEDTLPVELSDEEILDYDPHYDWKTEIKTDNKNTNSVENEILEKAFLSIFDPEASDDEPEIDVLELLKPKNTDSNEEDIINNTETESTIIAEDLPVDETISEDTEPEEESTSTAEAEEPENSQSTMIFSSPETPKNDVPAESVASNTSQPPKRNRRWIGVLITVVILLALAAGLFCGYKFYYIKTIESISLDGKLDTLIVSVESDADPSLLTVYCVGNGTRIPAELVNGKATFSNLNPDQRYLVEIEITGLHGLQGKTSATYYTPSQVSLEGLMVQVGDTDGSAKLSFTTKKPYNGQWAIEYVTEGEDVQTVTCDSSDVTLSGLSIGKTYEITIKPVSGNNWISNNTCTFTAQPVIRAQDVTIEEYKNGALSISWTSETDVSSWTVHCYNNTDYNKTVTVSECAASFDGLDPAQNYTVEIYADNQTQFQLLHIDDTTLPVENFTAQITEEHFIELTWTCAKDVPEAGWIIEYTISQTEETYKIENITENTCIVKNAIPGCSYVFTLRASNDAVVITNNAEITVPEAEDYYNNYGGTPFGKDNIRLKMCTQPEDGNWAANNLKYTTSFKVGQLAGFTTEALAYYNETVDTELFVLYVIRDESGNLVMFNSQEMMWKELFTEYRGTLSVPELPGTIGKYTLEIYYNGGYVATQEFDITE